MPAGVWAINSVETGFRVGSTEVSVDAQGVCKKIVSTDGQEYFVPTKSSEEWTSFLTNTPEGLTLAECQALFSDQLEFVTSFECPSPYNFMHCGLVAVSNSITEDGKYIFAFEDGYSSYYGTQELHIYNYDRDTSSVTLVETIGGLSDKNNRVESFAMNADGSRILFIRKPMSTGGHSYSAQFMIYSFDGSNASLLYSGTYNGGFGIHAAAISEDGNSIAFKGRIYEKNGSSYDIVFDNGIRGQVNNNDPQARHMGANLYLGNNTFYLFKRDGIGDIIQKQPNGSWQIVQSISPSTANDKNPSFMAVSNDLSLLAINSKKNYSANYKTDIYTIEGSGPTYSFVGSINLGDKLRYTVDFSANGRYLNASGRTWDLEPMLAGGSPVVVNTAATWGDEYGMAQFGYIHENSLGDVVVAKPENTISGRKQSGAFYIYKRLPE